jgi:hypothetical protein
MPSSISSRRAGAAPRAVASVFVLVPLATSLGGCLALPMSLEGSSRSCSRDVGCPSGQVGVLDGDGAAAHCQQAPSAACLNDEIPAAPVVDGTACAGRRLGRAGVWRACVAGETAGIDASAARRLTPPPLPPAAPVGLGVTGAVLGLVAAGTWWAGQLVVWDWERALGSGGRLDRTLAQYEADRQVVGNLGLVAWTTLGAGAGACAIVAAQFTDWEAATVGVER